MVRRVRVGAVACAMGLLLAGCTGAVERRDLTDASPLADYLGTAPRGQLTLPHLDERERLRQDAHTELVAQCMTDAGFEYLAVSIQERLGRELLEAYALEPVEFAREYGYGIATIEVEEYVDPNQQLREQLGPDRQQQYDRQLWGGQSAEDGCHQRASIEVYGDPAAREPGFAEFDRLLEQVSDLYRRIDADPRLREAHRRWADCMAAAGHPGFTAPADARQSVLDRLPGGQPVEPVAPGATPASAQADPQRFAEVREYELALAPVDRDCQRRHVDGVRRLVTMELEGAFVAEHRTELDSYRDWLAG